METGLETPTRQEDPPALVLRGHVHYASLDVPVALLAIAMTAAFAAVGFALFYSGRLLDDVRSVAGFTVIMAAIFFVIVFRGWRNTGNTLAIYDDRIVLDLAPPGSTDARLTILFTEVQRLALEKSWIRVQQKSGRRLSFKGARLHVEDAFDLLTQKVEAVNPDCVVRDR